MNFWILNWFLGFKGNQRNRKIKSRSWAEFGLQWATRPGMSGDGHGTPVVAALPVASQRGYCTTSKGAERWPNFAANGSRGLTGRGSMTWGVIQRRSRGPAMRKSLIPASSRRLGGVGEVEEHQGACGNLRGSLVEDGRWQGGLTPMSSRSGHTWWLEPFTREERGRGVTPGSFL
jgi:hypothetical protein